MKVHHIGYLVKNIEKTRVKFLGLGYEVERPVKFDAIRDVNIEFLINGGYRVELIQPLSETSPMYPLLKRYKNSPYHICYEVDDLNKAVEELSGSGYTVIQEPEVAPCIDDKKVAFLTNISMGIIELVEIRDF